jgi:hypothetical protein
MIVIGPSNFLHVKNADGMERAYRPYYSIVWYPRYCRGVKNLDMINGRPSRTDIEMRILVLPPAEFINLMMEYSCSVLETLPGCIGRLHPWSLRGFQTLGLIL